MIFLIEHPYIFHQLRPHSCYDKRGLVGPNVSGHNRRRETGVVPGGELNPRPEVKKIAL